MLSTLLAIKWERSWEDQPDKVQACRQVRFSSPHISLRVHNSANVALRVSLVQPDEPFLVKVFHFGPDQALVCKSSFLGFAEPFQGAMLATKTEDEATYTAPAHEGPQTFDVLVEDVDISKALKHLHKQTREMLRTHSGMYDGTLGTVHATGHAIITPAKALPIQAQPYRTGKFEMTDHWKSNQHGCKTTGHRTQP